MSLNTSLDMSQDDLDLFEASRGRLFGIAYRVLGDVSDAEDVVQDAWIRWQRTDRSVVANPGGFLTAIATRLAINVATSARVRKETYPGPWLPEPVDTSADPTLGAENAEALETAVLVLLERLGPEQRAAYVLREAFEYDYASIAEILNVSPPNARQLVSRAKNHVQSNRRAPVDPAQHRRLLTAFVDAAKRGHVTTLERLLAEDVVSTSDGGGVAPHAARRRVIGHRRVSQFTAGFPDTWWDGIDSKWIRVNGVEAMLLQREGRPVAVLTITASSAGIDQVMWLMAPAKLARLQDLQHLGNDADK